MGFSRPEHWSGEPFPSPRGLPKPGIEPRSPALQADSLPAKPPGQPKSPGGGSLPLLQRIFPTQESNQGLLHCRWTLPQLSYRGSPTFVWGEPSELRAAWVLVHHTRVAEIHVCEGCSDRTACECALTPVHTHRSGHTHTRVQPLWAGRPLLCDPPARLTTSQQRFAASGGFLRGNSGETASVCG